eukprot:gene48063-64491_t
MVKANRLIQSMFLAILSLALPKYLPPPVGGEYKSISVSIDQATLQSIGDGYNWHMNKPYKGEDVLSLKPNNLFRNYIESLTPYLNETSTFSQAVTNLK